jgi:hypothetical protein
MIINQDRFSTPQARIAYVTNRLTGIPYTQILPYIRDGVCQFEDYSQVLQILERAYGDLNRVQNTRSELFRFKQTNKEFASFFAEFQTGCSISKHYASCLRVCAYASKQAVVCK